MRREKEIKERLNVLNWLETVNINNNIDNSTVSIIKQTLEWVLYEKLPPKKLTGTWLSRLG